MPIYRLFIFNVNLNISVFRNLKKHMFYLLNLLRTLRFIKVQFKNPILGLLIYAEHIGRLNFSSVQYLILIALPQFINVVISLSPLFFFNALAFIFTIDKHIHCNMGGKINCALIDKSIKHALLILFFLISKYSGVFIKLLWKIVFTFNQ